MKRCYKCKLTKPFNDFAIDKHASSGYLSKCKVCMREYCRRRSVEQRDKVRAQKRAEYERNKEKYKSGWRKWYEEYKADPYKMKAHNSVKWAVKTGKLKRLSCRVCRNAESEAHHFDYSKPLDVIWLCHRHHMQTHYLKN